MIYNSSVRFTPHVSRIFPNVDAALEIAIAASSLVYGEAVSEFCPEGRDSHARERSLASVRFTPHVSPIFPKLRLPPFQPRSRFPTRWILKKQ